MTHDLPGLEEAASPRFRYRDFIEDRGETSGRVPNIPQNLATYAAIARLSSRILEPLRDFTDVAITYGFCSPPRAKLVRKWGTYQKGDQHVGHELNRAGYPICPRLGFAVDVATPSSIATGAFLLELDWDRIYFYGDARPIHVSCAPASRVPARVLVDMRVFPCDGPPPYVKDPADFFARLRSES